MKCQNCNDELKDHPPREFSHYFCSSACRFSWWLSNGSPSMDPYVERYKERNNYRESTGDRIRRKPFEPSPHNHRDRVFGGRFVLVLLFCLALYFGVLVLWGRWHPDANVTFGPLTIQKGQSKKAP